MSLNTSTLSGPELQLYGVVQGIRVRLPNLEIHHREPLLEDLKPRQLWISDGDDEASVPYADGMNTIRIKSNLYAILTHEVLSGEGSDEANFYLRKQQRRELLKAVQAALRDNYVDGTIPRIEGASSALLADTMISSVQFSLEIEEEVV